MSRVKLLSLADRFPKTGFSDCTFCRWASLLIRQPDIPLQLLPPRISEQESVGWRREDVPPRSCRSHGNHLIENLERSVLVAKRGENLSFTRGPGDQCRNCSASSRRPTRT